MSLRQRGFEQGFLPAPAISSLGFARPGANRPGLVRVRNRLPGVIQMLAAGVPPDWGNLRGPLVSFQIRRSLCLCGSYLPSSFSVSYREMPPCEFALASCSQSRLSVWPNNFGFRSCVSTITCLLEANRTTSPQEVMLGGSPSQSVSNSRSAGPQFPSRNEEKESNFMLGSCSRQ